jgi:hypothetical protein
MNELKSVDRAKEFRDGLERFGKAAGDFTIINRLAMEEADEIKKQKLQQAMESNDIGAIEELTKDPWYARLWDRVKEGWTDNRKFSTENRERNEYLNSLPNSIGNKPDEQISSISLLPDSLRGDVNEFVIRQGKRELDRLNEKGTVRRAAETAGIDTGYMKASEQDKFNEELKEKEANDIVSDFRNNLMTLRVYDGRKSELQMVPEVDRGREWHQSMNELNAQRNSLLKRNEEIRQRGLGMGIDKTRFLETETPAETEIKKDLGQDRALQIAQTFDQVITGLGSNPSDNQIYQAFAQANNPLADNNELKHVRTKIDEKTQRDRGQEKHELGIIAQRQSIAAQNLSMLNSQADSAAKGVAAKEELAALNAISANDYRQMNLWLKGAVDSGIGRVYGLNTNAILEMMNLDSYTPSQKQFIDGQMRIVKAKLAEQAKTAPKEKIKRSSREDF